MSATIEEQGVSIVLLGDINPAIFHPQWFANHGLLRDAEAERAQVKVVHRDAAVFETEWFQLEAITERLMVQTAQEPMYEALRDLMVGVVGLLPHAPIRALGINCHFHYRFSSNDELNAVGDSIAPKEPWGAILREPGLRSMTIEGVRPDEREGYIRVTTEPSLRYSPGLFVQRNDHFAFPGRERHGADEAGEVMSKQFTDSLGEAQRVAEIVSSLGSEG